MGQIQQALSGVRVLDWTILQQGPMAGVMLADLGAEVIKIESKEGDFGRPIEKYRNWYGMDAVLCEEPGRERNLYFETCNRNKKGITVNLKAPEAKEIIKRLVEKADILIQNFRVGVAERLGMDYKTLSQYNPRLIYVHASGLGEEGPDAKMGLIDPIAQARTGIMLTSTKEPVMQVGAVADQMGGFITAFAVLAALAARERTGRGQEVQTSLLGGQVAVNWVNMVCAANLGAAMPPYEREAPKTNPLCNHYKCADGRWVMLGCYEDKYWHRFCEVTGLQALENDSKFDTSIKRRENSRAFVAEVDKAFIKRSRDEWIELFAANDLPVGRMQDLKDLTEDPQVWANGYMVEYEHPVLHRKMKTVQLPIVMKDTPVDIGAPAPLLGEHNEEVLTHIAGFTPEEVKAFQEKGVI